MPYEPRSPFDLPPRAPERGAAIRGPRRELRAALPPPTRVPQPHAPPPYPAPRALMPTLPPVHSRSRVAVAASSWLLPRVAFFGGGAGLGVLIAIAIRMAPTVEAPPSPPPAPVVVHAAAAPTAVSTPFAALPRAPAPAFGIPTVDVGQLPVAVSQQVGTGQPATRAIAVSRPRAHVSHAAHPKTKATSDADSTVSAAQKMVESMGAGGAPAAASTDAPAEPDTQALQMLSKALNNSF